MLDFIKIKNECLHAPEMMWRYSAKIYTTVFALLMSTVKTYQLIVFFVV